MGQPSCPTLSHLSHSPLESPPRPRSMLYALDATGERIRARRGLPAVCPLCREPMLAKCGEIVIWHWAHISREECDAWAEPESDWHRRWKLCLEGLETEVLMGPHRADIVAPDGRVVELQHSPIRPDAIRLREAFYRRMVWLVDLTECEGLSLRPKNLDGIERVGWVGFRWKHHRRSWLAATKPLFFDLGLAPGLPIYDALNQPIHRLPGILAVKRYGEENGRGFGWGELWSHTEFERRVLGGPRATVVQRATAFRTPLEGRDG
jgi:competence protein CoiA